MEESLRPIELFKPSTVQVMMIQTVLEVLVALLETM